MAGCSKNQMRATRRNAKPGEVLLLWGRRPREDAGHIGLWGGHGATKRHLNAVLSGFSSPRLQKNQITGAVEFGPSLIEQLDAAGFDTTTLEFKIRVKQAPSEMEP